MKDGDKEVCPECGVETIEGKQVSNCMFGFAICSVCGHTCEDCKFGNRDTAP